MTDFTDLGYAIAHALAALIFVVLVAAVAVGY
jgi:hypothetical protein